MTYPRAVTAQLLDYDGTPTIPYLDNAFGITFYDEWNGPGTGSVSLALSDPGAAELLPGRYVNCLVAGTARFTFKIEGNPEYKVIERGEEYEQIMTVSGRGWACIMDEVVTYPEYARNFVIDTSWRLFSFASPSYPRGGSWPAAHEVHEYLEGDDSGFVDCYGHWQTAPDGWAYPAPIGFPWNTNPFNLNEGVPTGNYVDTYWIRPPASVMPDWDDTGYYFFRGEFTLGANLTEVLFTVTGDNFFTFFLEGVPILGEDIANGDHWMWQGWKEHKMFLPAGAYTVAAAVYNISFQDLGATSPITKPACPMEGENSPFATYDNPGGLLAAIFIPGDPVTPPVSIYMTNDSWDAQFDPDTWPGWTPGEIINQLRIEGVARGGLYVYGGSSFSASQDTNGDPWRPTVSGGTRPDIATFAVEVGSTMMQALDQLNDIGWINWHVRPGMWILDVWRGRDPASPSSSATLAAGVNLVAYEKNATAPYANALMVQWEGGYVNVRDNAAISQYGTVVEDIYSSDAGSELEAELQGENELRRRAQSGYPALVAVVEPVGAGDCPYEAFETGDYVTTPDGVVRCLSIRCDQDEEGWASWTLELNARLNVPERRTAQLLQQIGGKNQVVRGAVN